MNFFCRMSGHEWKENPHYLVHSDIYQSCSRCGETKRGYQLEDEWQKIFEANKSEFIIVNE